MSGFRMLLLAVDKSEQSTKAAVVARDLAKACGATVHVLHARKHEQIVGRGGGSFEIESEEEARSLVAEELAVLEEAGVNVEVDVRRALVEDTYRAILDVAEDISADVIVMGSRGLSPLGAMVLGSTTYKVLHASKRPVLVVP
ncbi:MAG: universal stress protein [Actinomycetota bacterium]|nr:universal stress protein [Actinomycetota bacterium]